MNITHYVQFNEELEMYELRANDDTLVAMFANIEDLETFAKASTKVHTYCGCY